MTPFMYSRAEIQQMVSSMMPEQIKQKVQEDAYTVWKQNSYRGSIEAATGVGKSRIAILAIIDEFKVNPNALVYVFVPTETLRDVEWPAEFRKWGAGELLSRVRIICHASMGSEKCAFDVDLAIWDEGHHITEQSMVFFQVNKVFRIMLLSATLPKMTGDNSDFVKRTLIDGLVPCVFRIPLEQAIELKLVADYEITVLYFKLDSLHLNVNQGTKEKPNLTTEAAHYLYLTKKIQQCMFGKKKNPQAKFFWIGKRMELIYNAKSKLMLAREVMSKLVVPDSRTLIFCGSIEQCNQLCGDNVYHSESTNTALSRFQSMELNYLGAVDALDEGKNIDLIDNLLIVQTSSKERKAVQRTGRSIRWRPGHVGKLVVLVAKGTCDEKWFNTAFKSFDKNKIKHYDVKVDYDFK